MVAVTLTHYKHKTLTNLALKVINLSQNKDKSFSAPSKMKLVILCVLIVLCLAQLSVAAPDPTFVLGFGREGGLRRRYGGVGVGDGIWLGFGGQAPPTFPNYGRR